MAEQYPLGLQLYSVRDQAKKDFAGTLKRVAEMGYAGVEFAGLYGIPPGEVRGMLDDLGLKTVSVHAGIPNAETAGAEIETARSLGHNLHICQTPGHGKETTGAMKQAAQGLQRSAELLKKADIVLGIHNHAWDTYWVAVAGEDPVAVMRRCGKRVCSLHIKDGPVDSKSPMTAVGDGKMDWEKILGAAGATATQWLIVELDACATDMMKAVEKSARFLLNSGFAQ
jgi:sugar phosphate isomerase/epimerase